MAKWSRKNRTSVSILIHCHRNLSEHWVPANLLDVPTLLLQATRWVRDLLTNIAISTRLIGHVS